MNIGINRPVGEKQDRGFDWLVAIALGSFAGVLVLHFISRVDTHRLVPVSLLSIVQAVPMVVFLYLLGVILVSYLSNLPNRIGLFTVAFVVRVATAILLAVTFQYDDERAFHEVGLAQVYGLFSWDVGAGYYNFVSLLYAILGPNLLFPKMVNAFVGSLLPFIVYDLTRHLFADPKAAWRAFLFTAFLPPLVIFSAVNLKEITTAFLFVLSLWFLIEPRYSRVRKIAGVTSSICALYWWRAAPWTAIAVAGVIAHVSLGQTWRPRYLFRLQFLSKLPIIVLIVFLVSPLLFEPMREMVLSRLTEETYFMGRFQGSSATVMEFVDVSNPLAPRNLAILFLRGIYSPSPLRVFLDYDLSTVLEALSMVVWYLLFPFAIAGFLAKWRKGAVVACGVVALSVLVLATVGIMVGSDPYRHRTVMLPLLFIFAGHGADGGIFRSYKWVFCLWWFGALVFTVLWLRLRY